MKLSSFIQCPAGRGALSLLSAFSLLAGMASCSDDNDNSGDKDNNSNTTQRVYILNQGSMDANNANIALFNPETGTVEDEWFLKQNGILIGDVAQQMIEYDGYIYVAVFGSNYIMKLDKNLKIQKSVYFSAYSDLQGGIRAIAAENGFIYASFYGGVIAKISASDLSISSTDGILKGVGSNLEGIAIENNKLYVADSYSISTDPESGYNIYNYLKEVKVVDLNNFTLAGSIEVAQNPNSLLEEGDKLFLISYDYNEVSYPVQMIDPATNSVTKLGYATCFTASNDIVYMVDSQTDYTTNPYTTHNSFWSYNVKTGTMNNASFLKDAPEDLESANIYMIAVDGETGDIYLSSTFYTAYNGNIYRFKADGTYVGKYDAGGQNPIGMLFVD